MLLQCDGLSCISIYPRNTSNAIDIFILRFTTMNKIILVLIVFCNSFYLKADLVLGMHAKGNHVAFAFKKTIRVVSVIRDSLLFEKEICKDTHIVNLIYQKAKSLAIRDGNENPFLLDNIKDFTTVNLTYFNNDLWIGFRYYAKKQKESILELWWW